MFSFGTYSSVPNSGVLIYNSKEWSTISSSGTLSKGSSKPDSTLVSFNPVYDLNCVSRFILWNRDLPLDYLIDYYNKNVLPNAACYFDVSKDYHAAANVGSWSSSSIRLLDHSGNNLYAELKNYNRLSDVTRATNSFSFITGRCEGEVLSEGIYHITKFTPQGNGGENMTLLRLPASSFKGLGTKISIYISTPAGKTFSSGSRLVCYEGGTLDDNYDFRYPLSSGMNVIDLTDVHSLTEGNVVYLRVPDSFCDKDAKGNLIDTDTDFYIVCFPVVNLPTHIGWAWYDPNVGDLTSWRNSGDIPGTLINKNKADITLCENGWDFKKVIDPIFQDDKIVVYPPFRTNFRGENLDKAGADVRSYNSTQDTLVNSTVFSKDENTGLIPVDYPGYVLFKKEGYDGYYLALYLNTKTVFEQVPNFYDFFQFKGISGAPYFNIVNKDSSYNMDIWNTVIMEFEPANSINNTVEYYCEGTLGNIDINESREGSELAYYYDIPEGSICYINGEENTTQTAASLRGKKTIVAIVGDNGTARGNKYIGCVGTGSANDGSNGSSTFKFYKFAAFKEKLTKEQINLTIDRYFN